MIIFDSFTMFPSLNDEEPAKTLGENARKTIEENFNIKGKVKK